MFGALQLYLDLSKIYQGQLDFKQICHNEGIVIMKTDLDTGLNGFYECNGPLKIIVLNKNLTYFERRDWGWHELYHHFKSVHHTNQFAFVRDEANATLFAALVRCPFVEYGDTVLSLMDRYSVSPELAQARIEFELTQIAA